MPVIVPSVRVVALVGIGVFNTSRYCSPCRSIMGLKLSAGTFIMPINIGNACTDPKVRGARASAALCHSRAHDAPYPSVLGGERGHGLWCLEAHGGARLVRPHGSGSPRWSRSRRRRSHRAARGDGEEPLPAAARVGGCR